MSSTSDDEDVTFSLKVMINKEKTKVLFVEADSDFVDVLLSFLTLPLGRIVRVLEKHYGDKAPVVGSLNTLYNGLSNLDTAHFQSESCKPMLLNPRSSFSYECRNLKIDISDTQPIEYLSSEHLDCGVSIYKIHTGTHNGDETRCRRCGEILMNRKGKASVLDSSRVFTAKAASFIISDDMLMSPNVEGSILKTLANLGITNTQGATLRQVVFGYNEIMKLLKGMFVSRTPLTDILLSKTKGRRTANPKSELGILRHNTENIAASNSKKMILKATVQKSSNKLCFVQANEDFVHFLFSLLTIPLGGVEYHLGSVDNLFKSLASISGWSKYFRDEEIKTRLLNPDLHHSYIFESQIVHPMEFKDYTFFKSSTCKVNYVKDTSMFMVADDLTVTPLSMSNTLSMLSELEIPLSDVKELELHIGMEEAFTILKASLTSTCALTDSLLNPLLLKKCLKQEN